MNGYRSVISSALAALLLVAASGKGATANGAPEGTSSSSAAPAVEVKIDNFSFAPQEIHVKSGTAVTWTNHDDIPHTVTSVDSIFKSKALDTDDKFTTTLSKAGTYSYFCSIHPKMTGKIVVE
jgi:plastocyanin